MKRGGRDGEPGGPLGGRVDGENSRLSPVQSRWPRDPDRLAGAGISSRSRPDLDPRCLDHPLAGPRIDPEQMEAAVGRRRQRDVVGAVRPPRRDLLIRPVRLLEERDRRRERLASVGRRGEVQVPGILPDRDPRVLLLFSDTPQRLGKIRFWDASETDTIDRTMYQIRGTTSTVT